MEAGIAAYEDEEWDTALSHYDAALERLGVAPEVDFNKALVLIAQGEVEGAKTLLDGVLLASEDSELGASVRYELGNLAFDAEDWDGAIEHYVECLKLRPEHGNAKWNLELARLKKKEQEEEQEQENEDQENENEDGEDNEDEQEQNENEDEQEQEQNENEDEQEQEQEQNEDEKQDEGEQEQEEEQEEPEEPEEPEQEEEQPEPEEQEQEQEQAPAPIDRMDIKSALEQLDEEDPFSLDKVQGGYVQPKKDW